MAASAAARSLDFPRRAHRIAVDVAVPKWNNRRSPGAQRSSVWLREELLARNLSPRSADLYCREIRSAEDFMAGRSTSLKRCTPGDVAAFCATKPRTSSTMKLLRAALLHYWSIVGRHNPPLYAIPRLKKPRYLCRALEEPDAARLEAAARKRNDPKGLAVLLGL